jgi:hypothetical protein
MDPTPGRLETPSKGDPSDWMSARCRWGSSAEPPCSGKGAAAWPFMMRRDRSSRSARFARQRLKESAWPSVTTSPSRPASPDSTRSCGAAFRRPTSTCSRARRGLARLPPRCSSCSPGVEAGERCIYVSLSQTAADLTRDRRLARLDARRHPGRRIGGLRRGQRRRGPDHLPDRRTAARRDSPGDRAGDRGAQAQPSGLRFPAGDPPHHRRHTAVPARVDRVQGLPGQTQCRGPAARYPERRSDEAARRSRASPTA